MENRILGRTGLSVSRLCCGTLTVGPLQLNMTAENGGEVLICAAEHGVNFFDTAQCYGTYPHLRAALRHIKRDMVIASKTYAYAEKDARAAVEQARRALDRDVIDIFLLHEQESVHTLRGHAEALSALYDAKARGAVRAVGLSTHHVAGVRAAAALGLDIVHPLYNCRGLGIVDGSAEEMGAAIREAHAAGLGVYGMKALGGGNLYAGAREALGFVLRCPDLDSIAVGMGSCGEVRCNTAFFGGDGKFPPEYASISLRARTLDIEPHCEGCGRCLAACPQKALSLSGGRAVCDHARCLLCGYCAAHCKNFCLKMI